MNSLGDSAELKILQGVHGHDKAYHLPCTNAKAVVVFYPGDQLQDRSLPAEVLRLQDPHNQARIMAKKFPGATIYVVMPSRLEAGCACFDHFLNKTTQTGEPLGYQGSSFKACSQLWSLLKHAGSWKEGANQPIIHLVGFSKGGVVLNQVLSELACFADLAAAGGSPSSAQQAPQGASPAVSATTEAQLPQPMSAFLQAIAQLHFLDVGLNSRGAYMTDARVIASLGRQVQQPRLQIFLHGTPRQWDDARRPWIPQEKNMFVRLLDSSGVLVVEHKYFKGQEPSLLMHFEVIDAMRVDL
ncbi:hypothetical protein WJX72_010060 [[Myrmecia] bisecta]|uniref:Uncharacterized protein n=1 Tax=[Myrmecia] bisecta TaxID=41462 RepID=A0AAW1PU02_9CHLO